MVRWFLRSGKVVAVLGASGGTKITTAVAQVVIILIVIIIVFVVLLLNCASCQILIDCIDSFLCCRWSTGSCFLGRQSKRQSTQGGFTTSCTQTRWSYHLFFNIPLKIPFIIYSTTLKLIIEPGFIRVRDDPLVGRRTSGELIYFPSFIGYHSGWLLIAKKGAGKILRNPFPILDLPNPGL